MKMDDQEVMKGKVLFILKMDANHFKDAKGVSYVPEKYVIECLNFCFPNPTEKVCSKCGQKV